MIFIYLLFINREYIGKRSISTLLARQATITQVLIDALVRASKFHSQDELIVILVTLLCKLGAKGTMQCYSIIYYNSIFMILLALRANIFYQENFISNSIFDP